MVARFGIFWRLISFELRITPFVVYALCRLHNFLVDCGKDSVPRLNSGMGMGHFGTRKCENPLDKDNEGEKKNRGFDTFLHCQ
jgi:hypothetical protein